MLAACLGLEAIPMVAGAWSVWIAIRFLKYATRFTTLVRLVFTILWSTVTAVGYAIGFIFSAWDHLFLKHTLTVSTGLAIVGWCLVSRAVLDGLKASVIKIQTSEQ